jgi:RimJ/RimL family protein N-acetyltransferase
MREYKCLSIQKYSIKEYQIVPIRHQDRYDIMQWRNEQIYHLRQSKPLDKESQDQYFNNVIEGLFEKENPEQILFSYLENGNCIGYGGLVHINWLDKNAEISFVLKTSYENNFIENWCNFLYLIENVGFIDLQLHKLFTYAFDLRPKLYIALEKSNYTKEATLVQHTYFNNNLIDVIIHSKINKNIYLLRRAVTNHDALLLFDWANDNTVRANSFNEEPISIIDHFKWFNNKINNKDTVIYILTDIYKSNIGQIRVDKVDDFFEIDYSISHFYRGRGFGNKIVQLLLAEFGNVNYLAKVKTENIASKKVFINNGFDLQIEGDSLFIYLKKMSNE